MAGTARRPVAGSTVRGTFDMWATNGRAEKMELEHSRAVAARLASEDLSSPFRFLDVGCGNGWLVRRMAALPACRAAVGIDLSPGMVREARRLARLAKERYDSAPVESWAYRGRFDLVFSMEALYYADSVDAALAAIARRMAPGARLICGTDFYAENRATRWWAREMGITMHLLSRAEWAAAFRRAGLRARTRTVRDATSSKRWRREAGTLFVTGTAPPAR
ncbi:MAG: class I SAM-dependent methyltransferase [Thaumarchaeota archaeon S14]|nr:MAG: class I SAM-dependent methyltransferase [Thaumarchaeota archaeon S14]